MIGQSEDRGAPQPAGRNELEELAGVSLHDLARVMVEA